MFTLVDINLNTNYFAKGNRLNGVVVIMAAYRVGDRWSSDVKVIFIFIFILLLFLVSVLVFFICWHRSQKTHLTESGYHSNTNTAMQSSRLYVCATRKVGVGGSEALLKSLYKSAVETCGISFIGFVRLIWKRLLLVIGAL